MKKWRNQKIIIFSIILFIYEKLSISVSIELFTILAIIEKKIKLLCKVLKSQVLKNWENWKAESKLVFILWNLVTRINWCFGQK